MSLSLQSAFCTWSSPDSLWKMLVIFSFNFFFMSFLRSLVLYIMQIRRLKLISSYFLHTSSCHLQHGHFFMLKVITQPGFSNKVNWKEQFLLPFFLITGETPPVSWCEVFLYAPFPSASWLRNSVSWLHWSNQLWPWIEP